MCSKCVPPLFSPEDLKHLLGFFITQIHLIFKMRKLDALQKQFYKIHKLMSLRSGIAESEFEYSAPLGINTPMNQLGLCLDSKDKSVQLKLVSVSSGPAGFLLDLTIKNHNDSFVYRKNYIRDHLVTSEEFVQKFLEIFDELWVDYFCDHEVKPLPLDLLVEALINKKRSIEEGLNNCIGNDGIVNNDKLLNLTNEYQNYQKIRRKLHQHKETPIVSMAILLNYFELNPNWLGFV